MNEIDYESVEKETRNYLINQRMNYMKMSDEERLELITTTLILGGARPNINSFRNDCLHFEYEITKGINEDFGIDYDVIKNPHAFADRMEGIDNVFQVPMEARRSLEGRKQYFADRIYNKFSTYDLTKDVDYPVINNKIIDKNWNQTMQDKMAVIEDEYREDPNRFGDFIAISYTDADDKTTLNRALGMRKIVARASVCALKNKDPFKDLISELDNNFGINNIVNSVDEVVDNVNKRSMQDAHQFKRVDLYDSDSEGAKE